MKNTKLTLAIMAMAIMAIAVALVSCKKKKTDSVMQEPQALASGMLHFNSAEEFLETQQKVLSMSETERRNWEQQKGFKSYATKCEELFEEFEAKGINSDDDIYEFVKENPDYFYIREEDGDLYLTSYLEFSSYYQFVDENKMIQIGNKIMKVFDEGLVTSSEMNYEKLLRISSFFEPIEEGCDYYEKPSTTFYVKTDSDNHCDCDKHETIARTTNGNNRTYARFYIDISYIDTGNPYLNDVYIELEYYNNDYRMKIRPYHRIALVWYWCSRTISYDISYTVMGENGPFSDQLEGQESGGKVDLIMHRFQGYHRDARFASLTGYVSTPDAYRSIICSTIY